VSGGWAHCNENERCCKTGQCFSHHCFASFEAAKSGKERDKRKSLGNYQGIKLSAAYNCKSVSDKRNNNDFSCDSGIIDPFLLKGIEQTAAEFGYLVLLGDTEKSVEREKQFIDLLFQKQADGMILLTAR
jgi:hypothetical protein